MDPLSLGLISIIFLFALLFIGVPVGITLIVIGAIGLIILIGVPGTLNMLANLPYYEIAIWPFVTLPMFLLLGNFALYANVGEDVYKAAHTWLGKVRGGLAIATTSACAGFGFASGSSLATAAMFTSLSLPEMKRYKYSNSLASGCIAASGTIAALIPPSAVMVIITIFTEVSLSRLLIETSVKIEV